MATHAFLVAVKCEIQRAGLPSERVFTISLANGEVYSGLAPAHFCWNGDGEFIAEEEPSNGDSIEGFVAARIVDSQGDQKIVSVPDGSIVSVHEDLIEKRPQEVVPPNVFVR